MIRLALVAAFFAPVFAAGFAVLCWPVALYVGARWAGASALQRIAGNVLVALDQLGNAALGGDPDMTISGRMGRAIGQDRCWLCRWACRLLDYLDAGHCARTAAAEADEGKDQVIRP